MAGRAGVDQAAEYLDIAVLRNVFIVSLVAGVGLSILFAIGVRSMIRADHGEAVTANRAVVGICLVLMTGVVGLGLWAVLAK